jgi:hypothetical protein
MFGRHLENVPWDAVSTTAGKAVTRNTEEQQYQRLMKPHVNYAMCSGAILKMDLGMLAAQLLGKTVARNREEQQYQGLMKARVNYAMCFRRHLKNVPWDAVSTTAGKAVARDREEQQHKGLLTYWPQIQFT